MIKVIFDELDYEVENGTKVIDFIRKNLNVDEETIMACKIFNEVIPFIGPAKLKNGKYL